MKYRIVIEWIGEVPSKTYGYYQHDDLEAALKKAKRIQNEDYPKVITWVEDKNGVRYEVEE